MGIEIPVMYRLGYNNNNCVGCVKGGIEEILLLIEWL